MDGGFFTSDELSSSRLPLISLLPECGSCGLYKGCHSPKMSVSGKGKRGILIIGEAPGATEDERNVQFVGDAGQILRSTLRRLGIDPNEDCWFTNSLICRPPKNRTPTSREVDYCRPNLIATIKDLNPTTIVPLGGTAVDSLLPYIWKPDSGSTITQWAGWKIPVQNINTWVVPSYYPSFLGRMNDPVLNREFEKHLAFVAAITDRPWPNGPPDFEGMVDVVLSPKEAVDRLGLMMSFDTPIAFDFETNMLKPDSDKARIVCCSVSDGKFTIAYPWAGKAIDLTYYLLTSNREKLGYNLKFEDRWFRKEFGVGVTNWKHCGMVGSHVLDGRAKITSLKFQAFVQYGMPPYDEHIKPYLESEGGDNVPNRIDEVPISKLLLYCGIDSALEWYIARKQRKLIDGGVR